MKQLLSSFALLSLLATALLAQPSATNAPAKTPAVAAETNALIHIASTEVKKHVDAHAVVTGKVAEINKAASLVRLNFDKPFPDQSFTAVIFNRNTNQFPNVDQYKGKQVEVTGKIILYRNHPEIQLQSSNQLKAVEAPQSAEPK